MWFQVKDPESVNFHTQAKKQANFPLTKLRRVHLAPSPTPLPLPPADTGIASAIFAKLLCPSRSQPRHWARNRTKNLPEFFNSRNSSSAPISRSLRRAWVFSLASHLSRYRDDPVAAGVGSLTTPVTTSRTIKRPPIYGGVIGRISCARSC